MAEEKKAIFRVVIDGSQEAIFRELTRTDGLNGAIFNSRMVTTGLKPGGRLQMRTASGEHTIVDGDIVEYDPPRRFVHTHRFTQFDDPVCRVTYELKPVAGGIEVTLIVDDIPLGTKTGKEMRRGGDFILRNLKAIVESGRPPFGTRLMYAVFGAMEFVLPKRTRTVHWPLFLLLAIALGASAEERTIVKEVVVKATPETTYRTWTTSEGITSFFAPEAVVDARPDGAFHLHFNPYAAPGLKGADDMRFLALQPPRFLSFTWNAPPHLPEARKQRTFVAVRLAPEGEGQTRVTLRHTGWGDGGEWDKTYQYFDRAWGHVLDNLRKRFETGPVDWTEFLKGLRAAPGR